MFSDFNFSNSILTLDKYNQLNTYLNTLDEFDEKLLDLDIINKNLNDFKYKFYLNYNSIYNILNTKIEESILVSLITYLLYDLDNYKKNDSYRSFYNKRWLFNLLESSLLNTKLLNIASVSSSQLANVDASRIADSGSFTSNTFILSKKWSSTDKFISLDNKN